MGDVRWKMFEVRQIGKSSKNRFCMEHWTVYSFFRHPSSVIRHPSSVCAAELQ
jgi:hypothetical protein